MLAIINERQLTEEQVENLELAEIAPEKFDPEITFKVNKQASTHPKEVRYGTYTREEVAELLAASDAPFIQHEPLPEPCTYEPMSRSECERLVREHFEYNEREKKKQEERKSWGSQKTIESEPRTDTRAKPSTSTKD